MDEKVTLYRAPPGTVLSTDYKVFVNGQSVCVYSARVSAMPYNRVWPGHQRPLDQTELASFSYWDMEREGHIEIVTTLPVKNVIISPISKDIIPQVTHNRITFQASEPGHLTVEVDGQHQVLHLFMSQPEKNRPQLTGAQVLDGSIYKFGLSEQDAPDPKDFDVLYFPPGIHEAGTINLRSGQTLYIDGGAVVYGRIIARHASNLKIRGRGILDGSAIPRTGEFGKVRGFQPAVDNFGTLHLYDCDDIDIEGIIIRDPNVYAITPVLCRNLRIADVKIVGLWRYNSDGIDPCNCENVTIERCFIRSFDDSISIKGLADLSPHGEYTIGHKRSTNILVRDCVIWNDWGVALEIGAETCATEISNVHFQNCDIIHVTGIAMDIQNGDIALVRDIVFEDIRVELRDNEPEPLGQENSGDTYSDPSGGKYCPRLFMLRIPKTPYSVDEERGRIKNITFKNIRVLGKKVPASQLEGYDDKHQVEDIFIENLRLGDTVVTDQATGHIEIKDHVRNLVFVTPNTENQSAT